MLAFSFYIMLESKYFFLTGELSLNNTCVVGQIRLLISDNSRVRKHYFLNIPRLVKLRGKHLNSIVQTKTCRVDSRYLDFDYLE